MLETHRIADHIGCFSTMTTTFLTDSTVDKKLASKLQVERLCGVAIVNIGDARRMKRLPNRAVDVIITSPPYINAIDYLRGHRLALVWLGFSVKELRDIRASAIGTEMSQPTSAGRHAENLLLNAGEIDRLPNREKAMILKYAVDIRLLMLEMARVLSSSGEIILVVAIPVLRASPYRMPLLTLLRPRVLV